MRLDASYNLCSKLRSKLIFWRNYGKFSFARPFSDFDCIFLRGIFFRVRPDKIYAHRIITTCALSQLAVWDFWRDFVRMRARGVFLGESLSKVVEVLTACHFVSSIGVHGASSLGPREKFRTKIKTPRVRENVRQLGVLTLVQIAGRKNLRFGHPDPGLDLVIFTEHIY
jgi:hypothetical protein